MEIAALFVSAISALSSLIKAVADAKVLRDEDVSRADDIAAHPEPKNNSVQALVATGIDSDYIEIATTNIQRAVTRFKQVLRDPSVPQAVKDQELESANFTICSELRRIARLNGGILPGDDRFHALWASHGCETS